MNKPNKTSLENGAQIIRDYAASLPNSPGVYRMLSRDGAVLYVGKAKALKKRVSTYANVNKLPIRLKRMVSETKEMVFVNTHTEAEALLLESNLIKKLKPRYNVLLRDDKSFPYIMLTGDHDFPLLTKHRGSRKAKGDYYGPFASTGSVNRTIVSLQKAFLLRNCSDHVFAQRSRPCLQYHIKRCSAPCVEYASKQDYKKQVDQAKAFLSGKNSEVQEALALSMQKASKDQDYEAAAQYRDRIKALTSIQARQDINVKNLGDADILGLYSKGGKTCIQVFFFRAGQNFGNKAFFPRHGSDDQDEDILSAFIAQFYENKPIPAELILSHKPKEKDLIEQAFEGTRLTIPKGGARLRLVDFVVKNAKDALEREKIKLANEEELLEGAAKLFSLEELPERIEVYDNSHISGTNMVGAMIVAGRQGFNKKAYRKFNIKKADKSDDYGMMKEVIHRRFSRALKEDKGPGSESWPDIILIDGGKGQLNSVIEVLEELGIADELSVCAIAKGVDRNAGREKFFMPAKKQFELERNDPVLHYLQRLRDEAHRFAIGVHRAKRTKEITRSPLDDIPGIGAKRKKALLHHFGSAEAVKAAGIKDLEKVEGISKAGAEKIYAHFHE